MRFIPVPSFGGGLIEELEKALREAGLRDKVKTIVGGAQTSQEWADKIGADAYAESAADAVTQIKN